MKTMIQLYNSFSWHQYFQRAQASQQRMEQFFPQWLKDHLAGGAPARITECGWHPTDPTDRDTTEPVTYWDDMDYFMRNVTVAGGVMVWLLSTPDCTEDSHRKHVAVKDATCWAGDHSIRLWLHNLAAMAP